LREEISAATALLTSPTAELLKPALFDQQLGNLDCVQGGALSQVVSDTQLAD